MRAADPAVCVSAEAPVSARITFIGVAVGLSVKRKTEKVGVGRWVRRRGGGGGKRRERRRETWGGGRGEREGREGGGREEGRVGGWERKRKRERVLE